jgi:predicted CoA-binding protein
MRPTRSKKEESQTRDYCVAKGATHRAARSDPSLRKEMPRMTSKMFSLPQTDPVTALLKRANTIAVVGLSNDPMRASHGVSAYTQSHGYRIIPVNPQIDSCLGEKAYASLPEVPEKIDIVNIFRRPEFVEEVVEQAIRLKVPAIWMQEDVIHEKAAARARAAGIFVVMDRCILKEHLARFR